MATGISSEAEEYIEAIYKLQEKKGVAKTKELADALKVVPGSVTNTLAHLEKHDLVKRTPYRGVRLTAKGRKLALKIIRRHRLAERLLTDILMVEWSDVHEIACKLEHALTENVLPLLERRLGYPKFCPHGNPIPTEKGEISEVESFPLVNALENQPCIVVKIVDEEKGKLALLLKKGIKPNVPVHIIKKKQKSLVLCVAGKEEELNLAEASSVWVKTVGERKDNVRT